MDAHAILRNMDELFEIFLEKYSLGRLVYGLGNLLDEYAAFHKLSSPAKELQSQEFLDNILAYARKSKATELQIAMYAIHLASWSMHQMQANSQHLNASEPSHIESTAKEETREALEARLRIMLNGGDLPGKVLDLSEETAIYEVIRSYTSLIEVRTGSQSKARSFLSKMVDEIERLDDNDEIVRSALRHCNSFLSEMPPVSYADLDDII